MAKYTKSEQTLHNVKLNKRDIEQLRLGYALCVDIDGGATRISMQGEETEAKIIADIGDGDIRCPSVKANHFLFINAIVTSASSRT